MKVYKLIKHKIIAIENVILFSTMIILITLKTMPI